MRVGSLFSGIGGMDLGLERAGMQVLWQVENDPYCSRVLAKHWPGVRRYGDIREVRGDELEPVDLIAGGFPCQPVSIAGKQLGQDDARWLWPEFARLIGAVRPRFVLVENVPGLLDRGMGDVLGELAGLGFDAEWSIIPACALGAPHTRERLFIVAHANGEPGAARMGSWNKRGWPIQPGNGGASQGSAWMAPDPRIYRMVDGIPDWMERLRGLGNAVVPQVAEWIGRRLMEAR